MKKRPCLTLCFPSVGCGGNLTSPTGLFTSPNYPMPYYHSSECYWQLKASHGSPFQLEFQDFHVEPHPNCSLDYLAVCTMSPGPFDAPLLLSAKMHLKNVLKIQKAAGYKRSVHIKDSNKVNPERNVVKMTIFYLKCMLNDLIH